MDYKWGAVEVATCQECCNKIVQSIIIDVHCRSFSWFILITQNKTMRFMKYYMIIASTDKTSCIPEIVNKRVQPILQS